MASPNREVIDLAPPTAEEKRHIREVVEGRGGKPLKREHGTLHMNYPIGQAKAANASARQAGEKPPFEVTPDVTVKNHRCGERQLYEVPYTDPAGEEGRAVLCAICDGLAATPDFGRFPRFEP
jgi:hypothetical protein